MIVLGHNRSELLAPKIGHFFIIHWDWDMAQCNSGKENTFTEIMKTEKTKDIKMLSKYAHDYKNRKVLFHSDCDTN